VWSCSYDGAETALELGGCDFLAHLEQLQRLSLERTLLGHAQLCMLAQLTRLTSLNLAWCGPAWPALALT
jgi:hypothetical protein